MEKLKQLASKLESKHFMWMVQYAIHYLANQIKEDELKLLRCDYQLLSRLPLYSERLVVAKDDERSEQVERIKANLQEEYTIMHFLHTLHEELVTLDNKQFAKDFAEFFKPKNK